MAFEKEQPGLDLKILFENEAQIRAFPDDVPYIFFRNNNDGKYLDAKIKDESQLTEKGCSLYHSGKLIGSKIEDIHESDNAKIIMDGIRIALETGGRQVIQYSYEPEEQKRFFELKLLPIGADEVVSIVR